MSVPVYNTEPFLRKCVDCLLGQTLKDIEVILVDDGSTDDCPRICDEYAKLDDRVIVIHQENGGLASARQTALERSSGEYFICCDSDDWVELDMYEIMYNKAVACNADIVISDFYYNYPNGEQRAVRHGYKQISSENLMRELLCYRILGSTFNKLVRRDLFAKYNISWEKGINQGEDHFIFIKLLRFPLKICFVNNRLCHYRRDISGNNYTSNITMASFDQMLYIDNWKRANLSCSLFGRELAYSALNLAFVGLRTKGMDECKYKAYIREYVPLKAIFVNCIFTLKSLIVLLSMVNYSLAKFIFKLFYKLFYK